MHVDTTLVREFASLIGTTSNTARETPTDAGCPTVTESMPGSSIATALVAHALLAHSALQSTATDLTDSRDRLMASADIYEATVDDAVAALVKIDGSALW
ncbi:MAG: type VII secretion target [Rhodococcus sp. (in: high G+C Gram-positive bacteria)]